MENKKKIRKSFSVFVLYSLPFFCQSQARALGRLLAGFDTSLKIEGKSK